jgi:deoxyribonuclease-4
MSRIQAKKTVMRIGFHVLIGGGLANTVQAALATRCQCLQIFASSPGQWKPRKSDEAENEMFVQARLKYDLQPLLVHAPYLLNLASPDPSLVEKSLQRLIFDMGMAHRWQAEGVVLHLGSGGSEMHIDEAMERVAAGMRVVRERTPGPTKLILENSAGQGNIVGDTPEELGRVVELAGRERIGVCLDTAHAFAAGYAINTKAGLDDFLGRCDTAFGLDLVSAIHANDLQGGLGSKLDRHWHIGLGSIGREGWRLILSEPRLSHLPFIMETPKGHQTGTEEDLCNLRRFRRLVPLNIRPKLPPAL